MHFGERLREQRERRGISLDDVAVSTRVSARHLAALEEDRFAELPGGVFSRGIVRSYAQRCGLDAESTVQSFVDAMRDRGMAVEIKDDDWVGLAEAVHRNRPVRMATRRLHWGGVAAMLLGVLLLAAAVLWLLQWRGFVHLPPTLHDLMEQLRKYYAAHRSLNSR